MRIGQTSFIVFISKVVGSALGFLATIYFARVLGAEVIGLYALVLSLVRWLQLGSSIGFKNAMKKRISEDEEPGAYLSVTIISAAILTAVISVAVIIAQSYFEAYVSEFGTYASISVIWFILVILFARFFYKLSSATLKGQRLVHIAGLLEPFKIGLQSLIQIALVAIGFGLVGMLFGYALGAIALGLVGVLYITVVPARPEGRHFRSLFDYAKYAWLGKLEKRAINDIDIVMLGLFVPSALVGIYAVAWSIAKFLKLFSKSVTVTIFPEISYQSAQNGEDSVTGFVEDSLAYGGLIAIPGLIGGVILSERLLYIYGEEFVEGATVLVLLIFSIVLYSYHEQLLNTLNGIDRPDLTFRINLLVIATNIVANVLLISQFGILGAAVATMLATGLGATLGYVMLRSQISFHMPVGELGRQFLAALLMGALVWGGLVLHEVATVELLNEVLVVVLVLLGASTYFLSLFTISPNFRSTVRRNVPFEVLSQ